MGLPVSTISDTEESANNIYYKRIYPLGMAIKSMQDEVFMGAAEHHPRPGGQGKLHHSWDAAPTRC